MKYLEAKGGKKPTAEHKMQPGVRADQKMPPQNPPPISGVQEPAPAPIKARTEVQSLADELEVDLAMVQGTGADGAILIRDVRAAALPAAMKKHGITSIGIVTPDRPE